MKSIRRGTWDLNPDLYVLSRHDILVRYPFSLL